MKAADRRWLRGRFSITSHKGRRLSELHMFFDCETQLHCFQSSVTKVVLYFATPRILSYSKIAQKWDNCGGHGTGHGDVRKECIAKLKRSEKRSGYLWTKETLLWRAPVT